VNEDGADRVRLLVRLEVEQGVRHRPPHARRLVRLAGVGGDDVLEDRLDRLWHVGVGDGDEVVVHGRSFHHPIGGYPSRRRSKPICPACSSRGSLAVQHRVSYLNGEEGPQTEVWEELGMNLTPVQAIDRINESVTVEMPVRRTKCCTGSRQVFLDSQADHRDPKNLGVVVTEAGRAKFSEAGIDDPTAHFSGKTIRVRGVVIRREDRPYIEVSDPSQIELVK
jgi:hypothetical protein